MLIKHLEEILNQIDVHPPAITNFWSKPERIAVLGYPRDIKGWANLKDHPGGYVESTCT